MRDHGRHHERSGDVPAEPQGGDFRRALPLTHMAMAQTYGTIWVPHMVPKSSFSMVNQPTIGLILSHMASQLLEVHQVHRLQIVPRLFESSWARDLDNSTGSFWL